MLWFEINSNHESNTIVLAYKDDFHDEIAEFLKNNNIKLLTYNPILTINKYKNKSNIL